MKLDYRIADASSSANGYRPTEISSFFALLHPMVIRILSKLFRLLFSFVVYSNSSGLTPPALASLFGPLIFGCSVVHSPPPSKPDQHPQKTSSFHSIYEAYSASSNAFEHLLLAYIRCSETLEAESLPPRLIFWVKDYPTMIVPTENATARGYPTKPGGVARENLLRTRKGRRLIRCLVLRRVVPVHSKDLIRTCASL